MKYRTTPQGFRIRHWRQLYDACIPNLDSLIVVAKNAIFVVFDAEPGAQDNTRPSEVAISMLQLHGSHHTRPTTLTEFHESCRVETHRVLFTDMNRSARREAHRFGIEHHISSLDAETFVVSLVDSYRCKHTEAVSLSTEQVVFVGFDLQYEFRLLSTIYTALTRYFTSWLDIQELARLASNVDKPGLSETLKACGFGHQNSADLHSLRARHNSATDTVRAAAILHHLFGRDSDEHLRIATSDRNPSILARKRRGLPANAPEDRKLWVGLRPKPRELYPYTARVKRSTKDVLVAQTLLETFAEYEPVAVGTAKQTVHRYGWVCLPSPGALNHFLESVDGAEHPLGGTWIAVSNYDPDIIPAKDRRELRERLHAQADEKREHRRLKRLTSEMTDSC